MKKSLIFGSQAGKFWFPDFREPKDTDILSQEKREITKDLQYYWYGESSEFILENNKHDTYVDPEFLYSCKFSHAKWDIHWNKTMADIAFFQRKGLKINDELYKLLMIDFTALHGKRWASLKGEDSKTFFEDAVKRKYVHDTIHLAVAYYDAPLYESILVGDGTVNCSKEKFNALSVEDKIKLVKEEIFVTALERYLIPNDFKYSSQRAYWQSLKKFITTMSSGWLSKYLIDNYDKLAINKDDYVKTFNENKHKLCLQENS